MSADSEYPLDEWITQVRNFKLLAEDDVRKLCKLVVSYLFEEPNVLSLSSPITICGDLRGQFYDLLELFDIAGTLEETQTNYLFLGNYVNKGYHSVETFTYLMLLKAKYPSRITLLRGNQDTRQMTQVYGFYDEALLKYNQSNIVWRLCCEVFDYLPLVAIIDSKLFCVNAGLSPEITTIDEIRKIDRRQEVPAEGPYCDLLWSDPEEISGWGLSPAGAGYLFGADVVHKFNHENGLDMICRSHKMVQEGYRYPYGEDDKCLVHIWSAPNFVYRLGNLAAVMQVDSKMNKKFRVFHPSCLNNLKVGKANKEETSYDVQ